MKVMRHQDYDSRHALPVVSDTEGSVDDVSMTSNTVQYHVTTVNTDVSTNSSWFAVTSDDVIADDVSVMSSTPVLILASSLIACFIVAIILGNILIIASVVVFREMRTLTNWLIVSLASADLLVSVVVLPISLFYEMTGSWTLGRVLCDFWITADIFCCTASILNIVVIATDRYWLITRNMRYTHGAILPRRRICKLMILLAWTGAAIISVYPLLGWKSGHIYDGQGSCQISQDYGYTIFSTFGAFWFPLSVILGVYFRIFWIAQRRLQRRMKQRLQMNKWPGRDGTTQFCDEECTRMPSEAVKSGQPPLDETAATNPRTADDREGQAGDGVVAGGGDSRLNLTVVRIATVSTPTIESPRPSHQQQQTRNFISYRKCQYRRMRNSARMLGLIIGGFVLCWLPFFLLATALPFCEQCQVPHAVSSVVMWLGYSNSLLNPIIYAIWDKNFRRCFKRLITCDLRRRAGGPGVTI